MSNYAEFIKRKRRAAAPRGRDGDIELPSQLYEWQRAVTRWAVQKGRASIFADCGLGKTLMQLSWASALDVPTLIVSPLCVAEQTVDEAGKVGIPLRYVTDGAHDDSTQIVITNYERIDKFDPSRYQAVVLDESSILKAFDGKTRRRLIETFRDTPYRLCCTATPSPNDIAELGNHAEFLGLMSYSEFLASWFVHDSDGWRMKKHAVEPFYRWMASWALSFRSPADLGFPDDRFTLPELLIHDEIIENDLASGDALFPELGMKGIRGRLQMRRDTVKGRVGRVSDLISDSSDQWIVWCGLNDEAKMIADEVGGVNVQGSDSYDEKVSSVRSFIDGTTRVLVSKPKILGFGMNFQHCSSMAFLGLSDSYESYYQCVRRCWRYGQTRPVNAHVVVSDAERLVVENVRQKEAKARALSDGLLAHLVKFEREELAEGVA